MHGHLRFPTRASIKKGCKLFRPTAISEEIEVKTNDGQRRQKGYDGILFGGSVWLKWIKEVGNGLTNGNPRETLWLVYRLPPLVVTTTHFN